MEDRKRINPAFDHDDLFYRPSWKIRRKFFAFTVGFSALMIIYVLYRWDDIKIAVELIGMATALWLGVLGFYTAGATFEDVKLFKDEFEWFKYGAQQIEATSDPTEGETNEELL